MKPFRTIIDTAEYDFTINHQSKIVFIGSCFTENIGILLRNLKFQTDINPFGILYNPISVLNALNFILEEKSFVEDDLFYHNERWNSYFHHGRFSEPDLQETLTNINERIINSHAFFKQANNVFITFGTAWVYELLSIKQIVSNCHKVPNKNFSKKILSVDQIQKPFKDFIEKLRIINPAVKIIFTISPVRHLRDGFKENFLSKSILRVAIEKIIENQENTYYFPAYEILTDDLRDYRFYNEDMVHPSDEAVKYIFDYFKNSYFTDETVQLIKKIAKINKAKEHRPFNIQSNEYKVFKDTILKQISSIQESYNFLDLTEEKLFFQN